MKPTEKNGRLKSDAAFYILVAAACLILGWLEFFPPKYSSDELLDELWRVSVSRLAGSVFFIPLAALSGYRLFGFKKSPRGLDLLTVAAASAVVLNNLPIIGLISGNAYVTRGAEYIAVFALYSFSIGLFEEFAFRGVLFPAILERRRGSRREIFLSTVVCSALFGAVHLINLFAGAGPGGVILQTGYSFLIGGMCSVVLLRTGCVWICVALHSVFDFAGYLVPKLGDGIIWDAATVTITALLGVCVLAFMLYVMSRTGPEDIAFIFDTKKKDGENRNVES